MLPSPINPGFNDICNLLGLPVDGGPYVFLATKPAVEKQSVLTSAQSSKRIPKNFSSCSAKLRL